MNISRWTLRSALALAVLTLGSLRLTAQQTTGSIGGRITTANGQGLGDAQIQVTNTETGVNVAGKARADGNYLVPGLEIGERYRVVVRRIGFAPQTVQPVHVTLGQTTPVNVTMSEQAAQLETITVSAAAADAIIAPTQRGTQTTISDTLLRKLPTLNRNFTDFVQLTPQVSTSGPGLSGAGVNNRYNNIQIDGATEKDLFGLGSTGQPGGQAGGKSIGIESVKEYQVLLAPYDVRVGNFTGLSVNAVTKSGTNDFHGSAYVFSATTIDAAQSVLPDGVLRASVRRSDRRPDSEGQGVLLREPRVPEEGRSGFGSFRRRRQLGQPPSRRHSSISSRSVV